VLHLAGRNGMHKYNNQDHAMMIAMLTARNIMACERQYDVWRVNQDAEYLEAGTAGAESVTGLRTVPTRARAGKEEYAQTSPNALRLRTGVPMLPRSPFGDQSSDRWWEGLFSPGIHKRLPTSEGYSDSLVAEVRRASAGVRIIRPCRNVRRVFGDLRAVPPARTGMSELTRPRP